MSEPTYSFTLTETERAAFAKVLGGLVTKLLNAPVQIDGAIAAVQAQTRLDQVPPARPTDPASGTDLARAILSPPAAAQSQPTRAPIELRDRWARDRKGKELPNPEGCYPADVHIWKTEQKPKYLRVTWEASNGNGFSDANCFDSQLWPWLIKSTGQRTRLYLVVNGKYLNVVGVRA